MAASGGLWVDARGVKAVLMTMTLWEAFLKRSRSKRFTFGDTPPEDVQIWLPLFIQEAYDQNICIPHLDAGPGVI